MKTTYIFLAILACSAIGAFAGARSTKTMLLAASGVLSIFGLVRLLG